MVDKVLPKLHDEDILVGALWLVAHDTAVGRANGRSWRPQRRVLARRRCAGRRRTRCIRQPEHRCEQEPLPGGLTTHTHAAQVQRYLDSATTTTTAAAAYSTLRRLTRGGDSEPVRPDHYQTIRLQMGGDGGSLEGKLSGNGRTIQNVTRHVHRETPPTTKSSTAMAGPRPTAPKPLLSSRPPLVGAPAFSSPPANHSSSNGERKVRLDGALEAQRRGPPPRDRWRR